MKVNGVEICKVKSQKEAEAALQALKQKYQEKADSEISFISEVTYQNKASVKKYLKMMHLLKR